jgi:hypothetical protein
VKHDPMVELRRTLQRIVATLPPGGGKPGQSLREFANIALSFCWEIKAPLTATWQAGGEGELIGQRRTTPLSDDERAVGAWADAVQGWIAPIIRGDAITADYRDKLPPDPITDPIDVSTAAEIMGIDAGNVRRALVAGTLRGEKRGGAWVVSREAAEQQRKDKPRRAAPLKLPTQRTKLYWCDNCDDGNNGPYLVRPAKCPKCGGGSFRQ